MYLDKIMLNNNNYQFDIAPYGMPDIMKGTLDGFFYFFSYKLL